MPATMPLRLCGNTAPRIISQRVAPRASAASFCDAGTVANTSRVIEVMIGVIMMATMIPAVMKLLPDALGLPKIVLEHRDAGGRVRQRLRRALASGGASTMKRPQPVDDRRDRGEEVDGVHDRPAQAARRDVGDEQRDADADRQREEHCDAPTPAASRR